jgi:hypothetical protein
MNSRRFMKSIRDSIWEERVGVTPDDLARFVDAVCKGTVAAAGAGGKGIIQGSEDAALKRNCAWRWRPRSPRQSGLHR